jgi:deoxyhypusine synthase
MKRRTLSMMELIERNFHHFNARAFKDATLAYQNHINNGGKMLVAMAGAMSSARIGITLAEMIRQGKVHAISCTGANLEESVFRLVAHRHYIDIPNYRYLSKQDDKAILEQGGRRVTDMTIPEDQAFRKIEPLILELWKKAQAEGKKYFPHEYFYQLLKSGEIKNLMDGDPEECWLLAAAEKNLPIVVPGWEDSTLGNIFASYCHTDTLDSSIVKSGIEYMKYLYQQYPRLSKDGGLGFFQIGGGIAGDFPICVVPSLIHDLKSDPQRWAYFCQISDSTTSYGSYSGAPPNEKITWDKLEENTPMFMIESDATIVVPIMFECILDRYELTLKEAVPAEKKAEKAEA